jgi:hypothetical protein
VRRRTETVHDQNRTGHWFGAGGASPGVGKGAGFSAVGKRKTPKKVTRLHWPRGSAAPALPLLDGGRGAHRLSPFWGNGGAAFPFFSLPLDCDLHALPRAPAQFLTLPSPARTARSLKILAPPSCTADHGFAHDTSSHSSASQAIVGSRGRRSTAGRVVRAPRRGGGRPKFYFSWALFSAVTGICLFVLFLLIFFIKTG